MTDDREVDPRQGVATEWLSTADAARYLGLTSGRIRAESASGRLEGSRLGPRALRFKREHLDALMNSHVVPPGDQPSKGRPVSPT